MTMDGVAFLKINSRRSDLMLGCQRHSPNSQKEKEGALLGSGYLAMFMLYDVPKSVASPLSLESACGIASFIKPKHSIAA